MICGWACPFGFVQELLYKIPSPKYRVPRILSCGKYLFLAVFVVLLPLLVIDEFGAGVTWFCKYVCPAGTLEAGLPMLALRPTLQAGMGYIFWNKFIIMLLVLLWSVLASRPFCRAICPLGAFYGLFSRFRLVRLRHDKDKCVTCGACHPVCPMGVKFDEAPDDADCITCMKCMTKACRFDAIYLEVGGIPVRTGRTLARPLELNKKTAGA
jgi:polyferredoxin